MFTFPTTMEISYVHLSVDYAHLRRSAATCGEWPPHWTEQIGIISLGARPALLLFGAGNSTPLPRAQVHLFERLGQEEGRLQPRVPAQNPAQAVRQENGLRLGRGCGPFIS